MNSSNDLYPGFSDADIKFWTEIDELLAVLSILFNMLSFLISIIGILPTIFHIIVLCRKSMRALTINAFLLGIGICDLARMMFIIMVLGPLYTEHFSHLEHPECMSPNYYSTILFALISGFTGKLVEYLSIWLAVAMAIIRSLVIKYPLNSRISDLIESKYGIRVLFLITLLIIILSIPKYFRYSIQPFGSLWVPPQNCTSFPKNYTQVQYTYVETHIFEKSTDFLTGMEGVLYVIIPSILLPISTLILIFQLRISRKKSEALRNTSNSGGDRTTKLVTFMTISFTISTAPFGILHLVKVIVSETIGSQGMNLIVDRIASLFPLIITINGAIHFFLCYFLSSQYRDAVREMFGRKKKSKNSISIQHPAMSTVSTFVKVE